MLFGTNQTYFAAMAADVPGLNASRIYYGANQIPATWPVMPAGVTGIVSIKPNPAELLAGQLDTTLTSLAKSAPPGSWLTAYHEANDEADAITAAQARAIHAYLDDFMLDANPGLKYGAILGAYGLLHKHQGDTWVIPGLDFYALDLYYTPEEPDPSDALTIFQGQMPAGPLAVTETNTPIPQQYMRGAWFREIYDWLADARAAAFLPFWRENDPAQLTGPWDATDKAVIYSLGAISSDAGQP